MNLKEKISNLGVIQDRLAEEGMDYATTAIDEIIDILIEDYEKQKENLESLGIKDE